MFWFWRSSCPQSTNFKEMDLPFQYTQHLHIITYTWKKHAEYCSVRNYFLDDFRNRFLLEKISTLLGIRSELPFCPHWTLLMALLVHNSQYPWSETPSVICHLKFNYLVVMSAFLHIFMTHFSTTCQVSTYNCANSLLI